MDNRIEKRTIRDKYWIVWDNNTRVQFTIIYIITSSLSRRKHWFALSAGGSGTVSSFVFDIILFTMFDGVRIQRTSCRTNLLPIDKLWRTNGSNAVGRRQNIILIILFSFNNRLSLDFKWYYRSRPTDRPTAIGTTVISAILGHGMIVLFWFPGPYLHHRRNEPPNYTFTHAHKHTPTSLCLTPTHTLTHEQIITSIVVRFCDFVSPCSVFIIRQNRIIHVPRIVERLVRFTLFERTSSVRGLVTGIVDLHRTESTHWFRSRRFSKV